MACILGNKVNMTTKYVSDEKRVAVTIVAAEPCVVTQVKTTETDGYNAIQVGYGKSRHLARPQQGHLKGLSPVQYFREFRLEDNELDKYKVGDIINVTAFTEGTKVVVTGFSKGRGFQGVVKRHGFAGHKVSHGTKDSVRMPGSIGATGPQHVFKGIRMAGHMGDAQTTVANLEIISIDPVKNLLYIKGAVPGARGGLLKIVNT